MIKTRHSYKKPDFLAVLVILVVVGVLVSATLQARVQSSAESEVVTAQVEKATQAALRSQ